MKKINTNKKEKATSHNSALISMSEHMVKYCDAATIQEREQHREQALIDCHAAAMQMAFTIVRVDMKGERALVESRKKGERCSGENSRMKAVLHTVIHRKTISALRPWLRLEMRSTPDERVHSDEASIPGTLPDAYYGKKLDRHLELRSSRMRVELLEDEYFESRKYHSAPIKKALGKWRPSMEWMRFMEVLDRPKDIPDETILLLIRQTRDYILKNYHRQEKMVDPEGPCL
jgi:hypothetical protein